MAHIMEQEKEYPFQFPVRGKPTLNATDAGLSADDVQAKKDIIKAINKEEIKMHTNSKDTHKNNKELLCNIIDEKISAGLQEKLERKSDCAIKKCVDPVWLSQWIHHHCMSHKGNQCLPAIYLNALIGIATIKQGEHKSVTNFTERVKTRVTAHWNTISKDGELLCHALVAKYAKQQDDVQAPNNDAEKLVKHHCHTLQLRNPMTNNLEN